LYGEPPTALPYMFLQGRALRCALIHILFTAPKPSGPWDASKVVACTVMEEVGELNAHLKPKYFYQTTVKDILNSKAESEEVFGVFSYSALSDSPVGMSNGFIMYFRNSVLSNSFSLIALSIGANSGAISLGKYIQPTNDLYWFDISSSEVLHKLQYKNIPLKERIKELRSQGVETGYFFCNNDEAETAATGLADGIVLFFSDMSQTSITELIMQRNGKVKHGHYNSNTGATVWK